VPRTTLTEASRNINQSELYKCLQLCFHYTTGDDKVECHASGMRITDTRGKLLFSADRKEVLVGAELLRVTGKN